MSSEGLENELSLDGDSFDEKLPNLEWFREGMPKEVTEFVAGGRDHTGGLGLHESGFAFSTDNGDFSRFGEVKLCGLVHTGTELVPSDGPAGDFEAGFRGEVVH